MKLGKPLAASLVTFATAAGLVGWIGPPGQWGREERDSTPTPPALFDAPNPCPSGPKTPVRAERFELEGRLLATRSGYDPRDGVMAVARLRTAASCFRAAGLPTRAAQARSMARRLQDRVDGDFAAMHSTLSRTMTQGEWGLAHDDIRSLLRLTAHLGEHPYVIWLENLEGKVAVGEDPQN